MYAQEIIYKKSKMILLFLAVFSVLFLDTNLAYKIGTDNNRVLSSYFFMMLLIVINAQSIQNASINRKKYAIRIVSLGIIGFLIKLTIDQGAVFSRYLTFFIIPYLFSIYLDQAKKKEILLIQKILLAFLITQTLIALYERITFTTLLANELDYFIMNEGVNWTFRASALLGHPLGNAMAVSTLTIFVLCSNISFEKKLIMILFAYIALFCFNERGNIIIITLVTILYFANAYRHLTKKQKNFLIFLCVPATAFLVLFLYSSNWGGRLFNMDTAMDTNTQVRLKAYSAFSYINFEELLLGNPTHYEIVAKKMKLAGIENGVISMLLYHGLVIGVIALILLILFQLKKMRGYNKYHKFLIFLTFYGVGITNPHLTNPLQWMIFLLAMYAFNPQIIKKK